MLYSLLYWYTCSFYPVCLQGLWLESAWLLYEDNEAQAWSQHDVFMKRLHTTCICRGRKCSQRLVHSTEGRCKHRDKLERLSLSHVEICVLVADSAELNYPRNPRDLPSLNWNTIVRKQTEISSVCETLRRSNTTLGACTQQKHLPFPTSMLRPIIFVLATAMERLGGTCQNFRLRRVVSTILCLAVNPATQSKPKPKP